MLSVIMLWTHVWPSLRSGLGLLKLVCVNVVAFCRQCIVGKMLCGSNVYSVYIYIYIPGNHFIYDFAWVPDLIIWLSGVGKRKRSLKTLQYYLLVKLMVWV